MTNPHRPSLRTPGRFQSHTVPAAIPRLGLTAPADPRFSAAARRATRAVTAVRNPHGACPSPTSARDLIAECERVEEHIGRALSRTPITWFCAPYKPTANAMLRAPNGGSRAPLGHCQSTSALLSRPPGMQRRLIALVPGGPSKPEALLAHEIRCLATGDLGALAWREPPPPPSRRATLRRQAISAARAVIVAVLPCAAVLIVQPFLHASPGLFGWARIATWPRPAQGAHRRSARRAGRPQRRRGAPPAASRARAAWPSCVRAEP